ncbi:MAG: exodeoxyribonuclease V subunit gamma, partial [Myxococcota bacterium]
MRTLHLHRSNRSEALVEALAEVVAHPTSEVFDSEWLVVNGRGMAVWLSRSLSERLGIWLGDRFLYPRSFVERAHRAVLDGETATATAEPAPLFWHLLALLDELRRSAGDDPVWRPLEMYFRDGGDEGSIDRGREHDLVAALAADLADTFDRYQVYRSDWLRAWAAGNDDGVPPYAQWQPALWRRLLERAPAELFAAPERHRRFIETCLASEARPEGIPPRICVFGLPSLPPLYLQAVVATAAITEVHWFLPLATDAYLGDLLDEKKWLKTLAQLQSDPAAMAA